MFTICKLRIKLVYFSDIQKKKKKGAVEKLAEPNKVEEQEVIEN
jgi:hypothetical protein